MAYTKTTWENGDLITAQKLNKLEQGVANIFHLLFPVHVEVDNDLMAAHKYTVDKTYAEVCALMDAGRVPIYIFHTLPMTGVIENIRYFIPSDVSSTEIVVIQNGDDYVVHDSTGVKDGTI